MVQNTQLILLLVRHGQSTANQAGTFQGQMDTDLSSVGKAQAHRLARSLVSYPIDAIYSSPLKRAYETAKVIANGRALNISSHDGLMELNVGDLAGVPYEQAYEKYPELIMEFKKAPQDVSFPNGESLGELKERSLGVLDGIKTQHPDGGMVAIVSHSLCLRMLTIGVMGWKIGMLWQLAMDTAAFSTIAISTEGEAVLVSWNQTSHLDQLPNLSPSGLLSL